MHTEYALEQHQTSPHITGVMEIDTQAIAHNYRTLRSLAPQSTCAAVLKANAYGFGLIEVAICLYKEGCRDFFVAYLEEALSLRAALEKANIYVLSGVLEGTAEFFIENNITPVLNDFGMLAYFSSIAKEKGEKLPCLLHIDTGMNRNGFDRKDITKFFSSRDILASLEIRMVMSHLIASQDVENSLNIQQRDLFDTVLKHFPPISASLADTGGIFLGSLYHYSVTRPGKGLFGLYPSPSLKTCLRVRARILQVRLASKADSVGYGATHVLARESRLATVAIGFADGYDRRFSNNGYVFIQGFKAPILGRISMDYMVVDVTDIPESACYKGGWAEIVTDTLSLETLAAEIGTISRELSVGLGGRLTRVYR